EQQIRSIAAAEKLHPMVLANFVYDAQDPWPQVAGIEGYLDVGKRAPIAEMTGEMERLSAQIKPRELAISVTDQERAVDVAVHPRGSVYATSGTPLPRGVPRLISHALASPTIPENHSGRLELARWMTDRRNPLV